MYIKTVQQAIIKQSLAHPDDPTFNMPICLKLSGNVDTVILKQAFEMVVNGCPAYQTAFVSTATGVSSKMPSSVERFEVTLHTLDETLSAEDAATLVSKAIAKDTLLPFSLEHPPLIRAEFHIHRNITYISSVTHHSIGDVFSVYALVNSLSETYEALIAGGNPEPHLEIETQATKLSESLKNKGTAAFKKLIDSAPNSISESLAFAPDSQFEKRNSVTISDKHLSIIDAISQEHSIGRATLSMAILSLVRARVTGEKAFLLTLPVAGRSKANKNKIGCFVNMLAFVVDLNKDTDFIGLCKSLERQTRQLLRYQQLTIEDHLSEVFSTETASVMKHLYGTVFTYYKNELSLELEGVDTQMIPVSSPNFSYPFSWTTWDQPDQLRIEINTTTAQYYDIDFQHHTLAVIENIIENDTLSNVLSNRGLSDIHQKHLAKESFDTYSIPFEFEKMAEAYPDNIAIVHNGSTISYKALNERINCLCHGLLEQANDDQKEVVVMMGRSIELIATLLAVLKSGRAYVPVDPMTPVSRLTYILEDLQNPFVICQQDYKLIFKSAGIEKTVSPEQLQKNDISSNPKQTINSNDSAYVIFTSGSTGRPKGVWVSHANVSRLLSATQSEFGFDSDDTWLLFHSYAFDFSVWEIFGALLHGAKLLIADTEVCKNSEATASLIIDEKVTVLNQTPSAFAQLSNSLLAHNDLSKMALRHVIFGGEKLNPSQLGQWVSKVPLSQVTMTNMYGITETTVHVTHHRLSEQDISANLSNIGVPISDLSLYILNDAGTPVAEGVVGEYHIAGAGLSLGYLLDPERSASVFVTNTIEPDRFSLMYKTGDMGKYLAEGGIEYIGRRDNQVQIRGYRIELSEIEARLLEHSSITQCAVTSKVFADGSERIIAFFTGDKRTSIEELNAFLVERLPPYMTPSRTIHVDSLPMTINGKVNLQELDKHLTEDASRIDQISSTDDNTLSQVRSSWGHVLHHNISNDDLKFFDAGGDSLMINELTMRLNGILSQKTEKRISVIDLLDRPSIRSQASFLDELIQHDAANEPKVVVRQMKKPKRTIQRIPRTTNNFNNNNNKSSQNHG